MRSWTLVVEGEVRPCHVRKAVHWFLPHGEYLRVFWDDNMYGVAVGFDILSGGVGKILFQFPSRHCYWSSSRGPEALDCPEYTPVKFTQSSTVQPPAEGSTCVDTGQAKLDLISLIERIVPGKREPETRGRRRLGGGTLIIARRSHGKDRLGRRDARNTLYKIQSLDGCVWQGKPIITLSATGTWRPPSNPVAIARKWCGARALRNVRTG